jgi:ABC-type dipeptide/oligopeptide/nickel transport system permease component
MNDGTWGQALAEIVATVVAAFVRFWKNDVVQIGLTVAFFFALAIPLLLVMLLLWYLDSTGWRPEGGFYKIGLLLGSSIEHTSTSAACAWMYVNALPRQRNEDWRAIPVRSPALPHASADRATPSSR